jgi:hypothetical protein
LLLTACPGPPTPLVPVALLPASRDSAVAWTRTTLPHRATLIRFRWRYEDGRVRYAGRGSARIAPPDSLRFDYAGPFGLGSGAAVVIGDSVAWADPEKNFRSLVPAIAMLWASLGIVRPPGDGATVFGLGGADRTIWRFAAPGDTLDYVATLRPEPVLDAEWRRDGMVVARSHTRLDPQARPAGARIDFPEAAARFELTVVAIDTAAVLAPALWRSRR